MEEYNFYNLLCCPACRGELEQRKSESELHCPSCNFTFPVMDGIPILFPCNVKERMDELFGRHWDSDEKAQLYDTKVEGDSLFGVYNHESEIYGLTRYYEARNLDIVLDAGCGNGRFMDTFPDRTIKVGIDASLNLLEATKRRSRGDFLVCGELEHLPFKEGTFGTVISCRVLQHLHEQKEAITEMGRVTRDRGDVILELYNTWNPKTVYKKIRMSPTLRKILNAPFRLLFRSMSPFGDWGLQYDRYNNWFGVKRWMRRANLRGVEGRGVGFGYHKYFFAPFYFDAVLNKIGPGFLKRYYDTCFTLERAIGGLIPFRYIMEKFVVKATKNAPKKERGFVTKVVNKLNYLYKTSNLYNVAAIKEAGRETAKTGVVTRDNRFHLSEALEWLKRAQDATPDKGVSRGYSVGWTPYLNTRGWQPSYPETTGYIIPTVFACAEYFQDSDLRIRAIDMADWEIAVQMDSGAVMSGVINVSATPAVFNTGQVMLGWLRTYEETDEGKYLDASGKAAQFLVRMQASDGAWRRSNSTFADPSATTYNSRVGWALILHGKRAGSDCYIGAGQRSMEYAISQQTENGWFENNCLSDPSAPLLHTICYAIEGLLGAYDSLGTEKYLAGATLAVDHLMGCIRADGSMPGRFDANWNGTVQWTCLTGCAQLASILLTLFVIEEEMKYQAAARKILTFLKSTQNCVTHDGGLRGGIKGSYPFDGAYGRYELLNWATKFYVDALLLDEKLS